MKVVCVGDCGIDHYLPSNERFCGGITANFAGHARREFAASDSIHIVSAVGDDDGAELVLSSLQESGIDCHIARLAGATPVQYIEIEAGGEKNFVRYDEGVLRDFEIDTIGRQLISQSDLLVAPVYLQIVGLFDDLMAIPTAGIVSIDFADFLQHPDFDLLEGHIDRIDVGFFGLGPNDREMVARIEQLARQHDKLFVVTFGAGGSRAYRGSERFECEAVPVGEVIDTTGAGDAFAAAFLGRHCHGASIQDSLRRGAQLAAQVIQKQGSGF